MELLRKQLSGEPRVDGTLSEPRFRQRRSRTPTFNLTSSAMPVNCKDEYKCLQRLGHGQARERPGHRERQERRRPDPHDRGRRRQHDPG
jgi:hypothetical protein